MMAKNIKKLSLILLASMSLTGCALPVADAGEVPKIEQASKSVYDSQTTVRIVTDKGVTDAAITVSKPAKVLDNMTITGKNIPFLDTASWYTFNIDGTDIISEGYVVDEYGTPKKFEPSNVYFLGRVYKLDGGVYGVLIPNGFKADDIRLKIDDTIFE